MDVNYNVFLGIAGVIAAITLINWFFAWIDEQIEKGFEFGGNGE